MSAAPKMDFAGRRQSLAAIHIARKDLALDDSTYRALLFRVVGKESAGDLDDVEAGRVIAEFRRLGWSDKRHGKGARKIVGPAYLRKIRALWWSAYHLGEIDQTSERALESFVRRQTGKDALAFLTPAEGNKVIEALRAICARVGYRAPDTSRGGAITARIELLRTQWAWLHRRGVVPPGGDLALRLYVQGVSPAPGLTLEQYSAPSLDHAIRTLGAMVRNHKLRRDSMSRPSPALSLILADTFEEGDAFAASSTIRSGNIDWLRAALARLVEAVESYQAEPHVTLPDRLTDAARDARAILTDLERQGR